ncbi:MAG: hypothetical protein M3Y57_11065 [Acidobacteriota bacterium]|nr:hypothetical protein [Acidobacteriota bacterium]
MLIRYPVASMAGRIVLCVLACWPSPNFHAQSPCAQTWTLPRGTTVKDGRARNYRFTVTYNTANRVGEIVRRQRITGEYTRGLPSNEVMWRNVAEAEGTGPTAPF